MTTIQPDGEMIRKAVKWISEERQTDQSKKHQQMIEEAAIRFNLSPMEVEYLNNFLREDKD
jgi:DNA replication protein DnaD